ncbi:MAG: RidA family protein [Granulosicoccaceae bacterium]
MKTHSWPENHWHWPVALSHYHGVRRGGLIFTGGQADLNNLGQVVSPDDLTAQTHNVLGHVESILVDLGAALNDVVKLVIYFTGDDTDEAHLLELVGKRLNYTTRPVVSTICLPELCYPGMRIELEAVAIDPDKRTSSNPKFFRNNKLPALPVQYSHVVRCNDLVFTSDMSAMDANGSLLASGDVIEQTRLMMHNLEQALALAGCTLSQALKLNVFYQGDGTADNWTEPAAIRAGFFPEPGPAATGISVTRFARDGLMTKIAVTAAATDFAVEANQTNPTIQYSWPKGHWDWTTHLPYKHGNRFGNLIHLGGQVALDANAQVLHPNDIVEQTKIALANIKTILADLGASMDDIVKVTTFYQGNASADGLHQNLSIRSSAFQSPGPATSGIPVPYLVYEHMVIEIEVVAIAG